MKETLFNDNIVKFEAAVDTPLREEFRDVPLDRQIELLDVVVKDLNKYASANNLAFCRKTWETYKKQANWKELARLAIAEDSKLTSKIKKQLSKINFDW